MKQFGTFLIGALLVAWMAYLSWPAPADVPVRKSVNEPPMIPVKLQFQPSAPAAPNMEVYMPGVSKSSQPSV